MLFRSDYLRALVAHAGVEVHYGQFARRRRPLPLADKLKAGIVEMVYVVQTEEKGSDVSLGAHLVWDACHDEIDAALVLSNDSDLQTPVDMAQTLRIRVDRKSTRLNSSHTDISRMPSSA